MGWSDLYWPLWMQQDLRSSKTLQNATHLFKEQIDLLQSFVCNWVYAN